MCVRVCVCVYVYTNAQGREHIGKHYMCRHVGIHMYAWTCTHLHVNIQRYRGNMIAAKKIPLGAVREVQSHVCFPSLLAAFTVYPSTDPFFFLSTCVSTSLSFPLCLSLSSSSAQTWLSISSILSQSARRSTHP